MGHRMYSITSIQNGLYSPQLMYKNPSGYFFVSYRALRSVPYITSRFPQYRYSPSVLLSLMASLRRKQILPAWVLLSTIMVLDTRGQAVLGEGSTLIGIGLESWEFLQALTAFTTCFWQYSFLSLMLGMSARRYLQFSSEAPFINYNHLMHSDPKNTNSPKIQETNLFKVPSSHTPKKVLTKSLSLSTSNSPRTQDSQVFHRDIKFPTLQSLKNSRKSSNITFGAVETIVTEEKEQNEGKYHLRHFQIMSDRDEFNSTSSHKSLRRARGKSVGYLGRVEQDREEEELTRTRKRRRSRLGDMLDKNQFNQQQTGIAPLEEPSLIAQSLRSEIIASITEIEESKQGLATTVPPLTPRSSSLNLIVDEMDKPSKCREEESHPIESIKQQRIEQDREESLLRAPMQKLQEEKQLLKKMMKAETASTDSANLESENISRILTDPIEQEYEENGQDSEKDQPPVLEEPHNTKTVEIGDS